MRTALILLGCLSLMTTASCIFLFLRRNPLSKTPSPTPTSMPPMPLEDPMVRVVQMMTRTMEATAKENRDLMETLLLGREQPLTPSTTLSLPEQREYDFEQTPLSPGIESVLQREMEETEEDRSRTERAALQKRLAELQAEELQRMARNGSADSLPGPWSATPDGSDSPTSAS